MSGCASATERVSCLDRYLCSFSGPHEAFCYSPCDIVIWRRIATRNSRWLFQLRSITGFSTHTRQICLVRWQLSPRDGAVGF